MRDEEREKKSVGLTSQPETSRKQNEGIDLNLPKDSYF